MTKANDNQTITLGPWLLDPRGHVKCNACSECDSSTRICKVDDPESVNARLIKSAPDLLGACLSSLIMLDAVCESIDGDPPLSWQERYTAIANVIQGIEIGEIEDLTAIHEDYIDRYCDTEQEEK